MSEETKTEVQPTGIDAVVNAVFPPAAPPVVEPPKPAEPQKPAEKPVEAKVAEAPNPPDVPKIKLKSIDWDILKQAKQNAENKVVQLEEELKRIKSAEVPADYKSVVEERNKFRDEVRRFNIERDPEFQKQFDARIAQNVDKIKRLVGPEKERMAAQMLARLTFDNLGEVADALSEDLTPGRSTLLGAALNDLVTIQTERQSKVQESLSNWEEFQRAKPDNGQSKAASMIQDGIKAVDTVIDSLTNGDQALSLFQKQDGDDKWNAELDEAIGHARNALTGKTDVKDMAALTLWGARAPALLQHIASQNAEIEKMTAELAELKKASPSVKGGEASPDQSKNQYEGMSYGDAMAAMIRDAGGFRR